MNPTKARSSISPVALAVLLGIVWLPTARLARAQTSAISVSGNPPSLVIASAIAGGGPIPVSNASTTYSIQSGTSGQRILAVLDSPLPAGVTLEVQLAAPAGAQSAGRVSLSIVAQVAVQNIPLGEFAGLSITYYLSAPTSAGVVPLEGRTVTFTISP